MARRPGNKFALILSCLLLSACGGGGAAQEPEAQDTKTTLGLFTSLPIYWGEANDISQMLDKGDAAPGWVRQSLEQRATLKPLDTLEPDALAGLKQVVLAQPRPLAPSENLAFDDWLRAGGRALVFADPMLTAHSEFKLGDPRRPQDTVLISPILAHWGLELRFDEHQLSGEQNETVDGMSIPTELAGRIVRREGGEGAACEIAQGGLLADCAIGKGAVVLVADAAMLDGESDSPARRAALDSLLERSFGN